MGSLSSLQCQVSIHALKPSQLAASSAPSSWRPVVAGIRIDRRGYFERGLQRQLELEAQEDEALRSCPLECVREVFTLNQLEHVLNDAEQANNLVMVDFYSSSCGACKSLLPEIIYLCKKGCDGTCCIEGDLRRLVFLKHNVRDEYDELTDLARFYSVRLVPSFTFFLNGSPIKHLFTRNRQYLQDAICNLHQQFSKKA